MKIHLPLALLAALVASSYAQDETIVLNEDTTLRNVQYQEPNLSETVSVAYDGQGHALACEAAGVIDQDGALFQWGTSIEAVSARLSFADLSELTFTAYGADMSSHSMGAVNLKMSGDAIVSVENVSGDVSLGGFSFSKAIESSPFTAYSMRSDGTEAEIRISDIGGKFSICDNSAERANMYASVGLSARVSPRGDQSVSDARVILRDIDGGIEVTRNSSSPSSGGYASIISAINVGMGESSIAIENIGGDIVIADNTTKDWGIISVVGGSTQWIPPNHELITGEGSILIKNVRGDVRFVNNSGYGSGGLTLLSGKSVLEISGIEGDVVFADNSSSAGAGAIYCASQTPSGSYLRNKLTLSADGGNIVFSGNQTRGVANAVIVGEPTDLYFNAAEGKTVAFYDPLSSTIRPRPPPFPSMPESIRAPSFFPESSTKTKKRIAPAIWSRRTSFSTTEPSAWRVRLPC